MKKIPFFLALLLIIGFAAPAPAQTTAFTYQGRLSDNAAPATGSYDLLFTLRDSLTGGALVGSPLALAPVPVSNGLFTASVDFGAAGFTGADRWLEISVRTNGSSGAYTTLSPRQKISSTPYALQALNATTATSVSAANISGALNASQIPSLDASKITTGALADARLSANVPLLSSNNIFTGSNTVTGAFNGNGGGLTNVPGALPWQSTAATAPLAQPNTGYLLNSASPTTLSLPASPSIGDTVRLQGVGSGDWAVVPAAGQRLIGAGIGESWILRPRSISGSVGIFSSADGSKLGAWVSFGQFYTSSDSGETWTESKTFSNSAKLFIACSADATKLVALDTSSIYTSSDSGVTWTYQYSLPGGSAVASSADGTKLVITTQGGKIYTSPDSGVSWTARENNRAWASVASSADGTKLVAAVQGGQIFTSIDSGVNWTARDFIRNWKSVASSSDGSKLVAAVYGGTIYTSVNGGTNWISYGATENWMSVASSADGTRLSAVVYGGSIYTSLNSGVNWTARDSQRNWGSIASSADGTKLTALELYRQVYTSDLNLHGGQGDSMELRYVGNGKWQKQTIADTQLSPNVAFLNGKQVFTGTVQASHFVGSGDGLALDATNIISGTLADGLLGSNIPRLSGNQTFTGNITANSFAGNGDGLILDATNITKGTLSDQRLSANIPLLDIANTFLDSLAVSSPNQMLVNLNSSSVGGSWLNVANSSPGGRSWNIISSGSNNGEAAGKLLFRDSSLAVAMTLSTNGGVGIGTSFPGEKLEIYGPSATIRIRNSNDAVGAFMGDEFNTLQLGIYNPTASVLGNVPANSKRSFFGVDVYGRVGSLQNAFGNPSYRNLLDDGTGNANVTANLYFGVSTRQMLNLYNVDYAIGVQASTLYSRSGGGFAWFKNGVHANNQNDPGAGGTLLMRLDSSGNAYATTFNPTSDRNAKENFSPINSREVLEKVSALDITSWNFKQDKATRHIGPMAQDFYAAFAAGSDDKHIATVDADGIALAAIKGLNQKGEERELSLRQELQRREVEIGDLRQRIEALEKLLLHSSPNIK